MIQPIRPIPAAWNLHWVDLEEPPLPRNGDFFLPTLALFTDDTGALLDEPQVLLELDQPRIEDALIQLFERSGVPRKLNVARSDDWDEVAWKRFSLDYKLEIQISDVPSLSRAELGMLSDKVAEQFPRVRESRSAISSGLLRSAGRVRSPSKRGALLRKAMEVDPGNSLARVELADMEFQLGEWNLALAGYEEVISAEQRRFSAAQKWWEDVATRPFLRGRMGRAMALWQKGQYADAADECQHLLQLNPLDNQGARFYLPMLLLLAEQYDAAADFFTRYERNYPNDYAEPAFLFGWGLSLSIEDDEDSARKKYREGMARNLYIAPMLLEIPEPAANIWHPNDRAEPSYAGEFIDSYAVLWDRDTAAIRLVRETHAAMQPQLERIASMRAQMADFQDQRYDQDYRARWQKLVAEEEALVASVASGEA